MCYRKISDDIKSKAVLEVFGGERISSVSKKYKISRTSLYNWIAISEEAIKQYFSNFLFKEKKLVKGLEEENDRKAMLIKRLEEKIAKKENMLKKLKESVRKFKDLARPERCIQCGCEKVYKNGYYDITPEHFRESLLKMSDRKIKVQHFICAACGESVCVVDPLKNIFYLNKWKN